MADMISRIYSSFRGVDFRGDEPELYRSPDALNMWRDYKDSSGIRTRPCARLYESFGGKIYGIFSYNGDILIHSADKLYRLQGGQGVLLYSGLCEARSQAFVYDSIWYLKDGGHYLRYDGDRVREVEGYIPTTSISRKPLGGGKQHEDVNMLSDFRINTFLADGESFSFFLDSTDIDADYLPEVRVNGEVVSSESYTVDYKKGKIFFKGEEAPSPPLTDGQDNVSVKFKKTIESYKSRILSCTLLCVFDNRVFFSGNPDYPNRVWHTSLDDPTYVRDLDVYDEGMDRAAVRGLVAGNNALWVFREPSDANTTIFYHVPSIDEEYGKIYPSAHSSVSIGCVGAAVNFNDDIVFFSERGMEGISSDITTEQAVSHRSSLVDRSLTCSEGYRGMMLAEWCGYLLVFIGKKVFLADSRARFQLEDHLEYEWFYWELEGETESVLADGGVLYLGMGGALYVLEDLSAACECRWVTPKDRFGYPHMQKTTNKRGCVAEGGGDISVFARTETGDFENVGEYSGVTDYFVPRIKRKKFKDIQLKFESHTRFSLESVTLECFIGGYIKR